jgi:hypothetical protein
MKKKKRSCKILWRCFFWIWRNNEYLFWDDRLTTAYLGVLLMFGIELILHVADMAPRF